MAVREYIGARYIPIFADPLEWDINTEYEPLTVVKYQGNSYVSRRAVPEDIQITDTDYWVLWADYNAQLQTYINQVNAFDGRIDALEDAMPIADFDSTHTVSGKFGDVATDLVSLDGRLDAIEANGWVTNARIANHTIDPDKLNKSIVLIGDSWGEGWTPDGHVTSWISLVTDYLEDIGYTVFSEWLGGVGILANGGWIPVLNSLLADMTADQKNSVSTVLIGAGWNDNAQSSDSAYQTAMSDLCAAIQAAFPNAEFIYDWFGNGDITNSTSKAGAARIISAYHACAKACQGLPVRLVYGIETLLSSGFFASDGFHPTNSGEKWVAKHVLGTLFGTPAIIPQESSQITLTPIDSDGNTIGTNSNTLKYTVNQSGVYLESNSHGTNSEKCANGYFSGSVVFTSGIATTFTSGVKMRFACSGVICNWFKNDVAIPFNFIAQVQNSSAAAFHTGEYFNMAGLAVFKHGSNGGLICELYSKQADPQGVSYLSGDLKQIQANA